MKNFKKKIAAIIMSVFCFAALIPAVPAMADEQKVVTLGADLSEDQQITMLKYFGVYGEPVETLFINNTEEREYLEAYVPIEQIGTRTVSCAMVNPTTSGGIQVRTANLTWVTGNMISSTLSTSGVVNCEVLAAAPFPVSGTGALTGIMVAYEAASGESLDEAKKDAATQELVATATIAGDIGQDTAVQIVNETKIEVVEGDISTTEEIQGIVDDAAQDLEVSLSQEDRDLLVGLLDTLSGLDYEDDEVDAMKDNLDPDEDDSSSAADSSADETADSDTSSDSGNILENADPSVFGDDVIESSTDDNETQDNEEKSDEDAEFLISELNLIPNTDKDEIDSEEEVQELIPDTGNEEIDSEEVPEQAAPGLNYLTVQSSMTDLVPGNGSVSIYNAENDKLIETINMDDPEHVVCAEITDAETLKDLDWDEGIEYRIILSDPLEPDSSYYVLLSDDAFNAKDGTLSLTASAPDDWAFETAAYGISVEETVDGVKAGEPAAVNLYMDPEADYALVEYILPDGTEVFTGDEYIEDCSFDLTFDQAGKITVKASYYADEAAEEPEVSDESGGLAELEGAAEFAEPISEAEYTVIVNIE